MGLISRTYYLSEPAAINRAIKDLELSEDEILSVVGRFSKQSWRAGQLRGEVVINNTDKQIRHAFTKKILWSSSD